MFLFTSLEAKDKDISRLKREMKERKQLNHKLRELITENQRVADETRQDLQRLVQGIDTSYIQATMLFVEEARFILPAIANIK